MVVVLAVVVAEEAHRVVLCNVLWVVLHEFLDTVPESRNGLDVFVETEHKAVLLALLLHQPEGVVMNVAEDLDAGLNTPVVIVVHHEGLAEKEARLESAHVTIADGVSVDDLALPHVLADLLGPLLINVRRERPVLLGDLAIMCCS